MTVLSFQWDERNLLHQTYRLLQETVRMPGFHALTVCKSIPPGAGLGGGSGNAAVFLRYLIRSHQLELGDGEPNRLAQSYGADVPFFLTAGRLWWRVSENGCVSWMIWKCLRFWP